MQPPQIELIPLRPAVRSDLPHVLDLLVRITPPKSDTDGSRPAINLGLVLDNSGSMEGKKIESARQAAIFTVNQLLPTDRVSVTTFNSFVHTIVPNTFVTHKRQIVSQIEQVQPDLKTALYLGWVEGSQQVGSHLIADGINRVLLLSDGLANVGLTDPKAIANEVRGLAEEGLSTTTMGVGDDFNEDLMETMARAGGGNYYYIESPGQLPAIFQAELEDMMMTAGFRVRLGFEPRNGVKVSRVLNDFELNDAGQRRLPNLVAGRSIGVLIRLNVPPQAGRAELCRFLLEWDEPRPVEPRSLRTRLLTILPHSNGRKPEPAERKSLAATLALPAVTGKKWVALPVDAFVQEQVVLLMSARAKKEAARAMRQGDVAKAKSVLAKSRLSASSIMTSPALEKELDDIAVIEADIERGEVEKVNKRAKFQSWSRLSASSILPSPLAETEEG